MAVSLGGVLVGVVSMKIQLSFLALLKVHPVVMVFLTVEPEAHRVVTLPPTHHLNLYLTLNISSPIAYVEVSSKPGLLMEIREIGFLLYLNSRGFGFSKNEKLLT